MKADDVTSNENGADPANAPANAPDPAVVDKAAGKQEQKEALSRTPSARPSNKRPVQTPSVGRIVHYIDREMAVHAATVQRTRAERGDDRPVDIEPHAATIASVHRVDGELTGNVGLIVMHPELGPRILHDVPFSLQYAVGHWSWPPYVP